MKRRVTIRLNLASKDLVETLLKALQPETKKPTTSRSKVYIEGKDKQLILQIHAKDTSALRAALNSYLRWITLARDTYEVTAKLEKTG